MGKPTAADLKLGLATAPVLFACERVSSKKNFKFYIYSTKI
jgi:geranylgeranyl pyrophosphate synthase